MKKISILLPVYNEAENILNFFSALSSVINKIKTYEFDIVYILDKSTDDSFKIVSSLCHQNKNVKLIHLSRRFGHQKSILAGLSLINGSDYYLMMDSDFQHPVNLIPTLINKIEDNFDIVYTIRQDSTRSVPIFNKLTSYFFYKFFKYISNLDMNQNVADFRIISRKVRNELVLNFKEQDIFLRGIFSWMGYKQTFISYIPNERESGTSKYNFSKRFNFALNAVVSFSDKPLFFSIKLSLFFAFLSVLYVLFLIINYFVSGDLPSGWTSIIVFMLTMFSVVMFVCGIIGIYVAKVYDGVKNRPNFIIEDTFNINDKKT